MLFSYAEVRAERRREFGFEELSPPEVAPSSVKVKKNYGPFPHSARGAYMVTVPFGFRTRTRVSNVPLCPRLRSCIWTSAPHCTRRGTETAARGRCPPTAPGSPPTRRCRTLHVSPPRANSPNGRSICREVLLL